MLDLKFLGLGGDSAQHNDFPAQFLVGDTEEDSPGVLVGYSAHTESALRIFEIDPNSIRRIFVLNLLDTQVGGLENLALSTFYGTVPKKTLYVPEALVEDLWEKLRRPLEAVAGARHKRVTMDVYFNVVSLSEENSVMYEGDLEIRPFRLPCVPGIHCFGLFVTNTVGPNLAIMPYGTLSADHLKSVEKLLGPSGSMVVGISDVIPVRSELTSLASLKPGSLGRTILCGAEHTTTITKEVKRGERVLL